MRGSHCFSLKDFSFDGDCSFSRSHRSGFTTFSATSALAPLYFAPLLSCVVDQRTSPSLETKRTAILASLIVSVDAWESAIPAPRAMNPPLLDPDIEPLLPLIEPWCDPAAPLTLVASELEWNSWEDFSRPTPFRIASAVSLFSVTIKRWDFVRVSITIACACFDAWSSPKLSTYTRFIFESF